MGWKKSIEPRDQIVTIRYTLSELKEIRELMKREKISKQEAARRLAFPGGRDGLSGVFEK